MAVLITNQALIISALLRSIVSGIEGCFMDLWGD